MNVKIIVFLRDFCFLMDYFTSKNIHMTQSKEGKSVFGLSAHSLEKYATCDRASQVDTALFEDVTSQKKHRFNRPERLGVLLPGPLPPPYCPPSHSGLGGGTWAARRSAGCTALSWTAAASRELAGMGCRGENIST